MSLARPYRSQDGFFRGDRRRPIGQCHNIMPDTGSYNHINNNIPSDARFYYTANYNNFSKYPVSYGNLHYAYGNNAKYDVPASKKRKFSAAPQENCGMPQLHQDVYVNNVPPKYLSIAYDNVPLKNHNVCGNSRMALNNRSAVPTSTTSAISNATKSDANAYSSNTSKRDRSIFEGDDEEVVLLSKDEIERCSPSRKDGIDAIHETQLRYSYCGFLQNLGIRLELPQTTIGTAMVLCHRFFVRRSHACHDRFLIASAALFLSTKSEETPRPLNDVLRAACEILHKQDLAFLSYMLPVDWFEQYRERVIEAEQMILTTLNFELNVQHPYASLTNTLEKLGFSQSVLVNLALSLVSEG